MATKMQGIMGGRNTVSVSWKADEGNALNTFVRPPGEPQ